MYEHQCRTCDGGSLAADQGRQSYDEEVAVAELSDRIS